MFWNKKQDDRYTKTRLIDWRDTETRRLRNKHFTSNVVITQEVLHYGLYNTRNINIQ